MCAARAFWFAEYLGHRDAHVLDGGIGAWTASGLPLERESQPPMPAKFGFQADPARVATYASVLQAMVDPGCMILDTRRRSEFTGEEKLARHGGAIPGAMHCDWVNLYDHATGRMKPVEELSGLFERLGATPDKEITVYCNTGYRSAHAYLALRLLGYSRVRNYGNREGLPIAHPA